MGGSAFGCSSKQHRRVPVPVSVPAVPVLCCQFLENGSDSSGVRFPFGSWALLSPEGLERHLNAASRSIAVQLPSLRGQL